MCFYWLVFYRIYFVSECNIRLVWRDVCVWVNKRLKYIVGLRKCVLIGIRSSIIISWLIKVFGV